jgi:hypothetical protein
MLGMKTRGDVVKLMLMRRMTMTKLPKCRTPKCDCLSKRPMTLEMSLQKKKKKKRVIFVWRVVQEK